MCIDYQIPILVKCPSLSKTTNEAITYNIIYSSYKDPSFESIFIMRHYILINYCVC